jgi:hypothetical protein
MKIWESSTQAPKQMLAKIQLKLNEKKKKKIIDKTN